MSDNASLFEQGAAAGTALAALVALWLAERRTRFDARRSFVEFTLKQRAVSAAELQAALTYKMQVLEEVCYWHAQVRAHLNIEISTRELIRRRDDVLPGATKRLNDSVAAANIAFSSAVIRSIDAAVGMMNRIKASAQPTFDRQQSMELLAGVVHALRREMLFPEVLKYQQELFRTPWWRRELHFRERKGVVATEGEGVITAVRPPDLP